MTTPAPREGLSAEHEAAIRYEDGEPVVVCSCGQQSGADTFAEHFNRLLRAQQPEHGRCCECFDGPNFAGGHEHWGDEV